MSKITAEESIEQAGDRQLSYVNEVCKSIDFVSGFRLGMILGAEWQENQMQEHTKQNIEALREVLKENINVFIGINPNYPEKSDEKYIPMVSNGSIDKTFNQFLENIK